MLKLLGQIPVQAADKDSEIIVRGKGRPVLVP